MQLTSHIFSTLYGIDPIHSMYRYSDAANHHVWMCSSMPSYANCNEGDAPTVRVVVNEQAIFALLLVYWSPNAWNIHPRSWATTSCEKKITVFGLYLLLSCAALCDTSRYTLDASGQQHTRSQWSCLYIVLDLWVTTPGILLIPAVPESTMVLIKQFKFLPSIGKALDIDQIDPHVHGWYSLWTLVTYYEISDPLRTD